MESAAWIQAGAALLMMVATVALVIVTVRYVRLSHNLVKSQVEPVIDFEVALDGREVVIQNSGAFQIQDISVNVDTAIFAGAPPTRIPLTKYGPRRRIPGQKFADWWHLKILEPSEIQTHPISDVVDEALNLVAVAESTRQAANEDRKELSPFVFFRLLYHRDFDHKRYSMRKVVQVVREKSTGKAFAVAAEDLEVLFLRGLLPKVDDVI